MATNGLRTPVDPIELLMAANKKGLQDGFFVHELKCVKCQSICIVPIGTSHLMKTCPKCANPTLYDSKKYRRMLIEIVKCD